jgi:hypothetical protein
MMLVCSLLLLTTLNVSSGSTIKVCVLTPATPVTIGTQHEDPYIFGGPFLSALLKNTSRYIINSGISIKDVVQV